MNRPNRGSESLRVDSSASNYAVDRGSMSPAFSLASIPTVSPEPAYIAAAAAANVIAGEIAHEFHVELQDGASVNPGCLQLINNFLDRLLFNFLSSAQSTSLGALRISVTEVLRPRLAEKAIAGADEELEEYLGGDLAELDYLTSQTSDEAFDLEIAWKRSRLRCMLYTRLGDMEEEEEETYLERDDLGENGAPGGQIRPEVAIFLTSVLEFIGEHALMIAAQAAYKKHETRSRIEGAGFSRIVVEEADMEKNALSASLGRLWRSWRATIRSPRGSVSRLHGMRGFRGFSISSKSSFTTESHAHEEPKEVPSVEEVLQEPDPANIPLPVTVYDVDEIEVPGYSVEYTERKRKLNDRLRARAESMYIHPGMFQYTPEIPIEAQKEETSSDGSVEESEEIGSNSGEEEETEEDVSESEEKTPTIPSQPFRPRASSVPTRDVPTLVLPSSPSETSFITSMEDAPSQTSEIKTKAETVLDASGNITVIGDYDIPKSSSAPGSPYGTSMLDAISASAAHGFAGQSFYHEEDIDHDPADIPVQFDRNDYEIGEHEHSNLQSRVSTLEPTKNLSGPFNYPMPVSPLVGAAETSPTEAVSPLDPVFPRQEVSPLDESGDEGRTSYIDAKSRSGAKPHSPISPPEDSIASRTASVDAAALAAVTATAAASEMREKRTNQFEEFPEPPVHRANQGRQRTREGPTSQDYAKDENREAYVLPQEVDLSQIPGDIRSVSDVDTRRWRPAEKAAPPTSLPPVRESFEQRPHASTTQPEPTRQHPVSRKAVPASNASQTRQKPKVATDVEPLTSQHIVSSPISVKDTSPAYRTTDSTLRATNSLKQTPSVSAKQKGRVGSLSTEQRDSVPSRSPSGDYKNLSYDHVSRSSTSNSDPHRDFDQLVSSGETIQYSLTSASMREIEERGRESGQNTPSPSHGRERALSPEQKKPFQPSPQSIVQGPSPTSINGLRANPTSEMPIPVTTPPQFVVHAGPPVKRGPQLQPKDARMERTDTADLKEFLQSTPPASATPQLRGPIPRAPRNAQGQRQSSLSPTTTSRTGSVRGKPKFEARDARVPRTDEDTAALTEFFRRGPPGAPKTQSEEYGGRLAPSVASTQGSVAARSVQSSVNSRIGLLESTRAQNLAAQNYSSWDRRAPGVADESMAPVRKQRRVMDPYAIDSDDEDGGQEAKEESLLDFLRNAQPPAELEAEPISALPKDRRSVGPSMKSRFGSTNKKSGQQIATNGQRSVSSTVNPTQNYQTSSALGGSYSNVHGNPYGSVRQSSAPRSYGIEDNKPAPRMNGSVPRTGKKPMARDSRPESTSVRDLADFFRNSDPPPSSMSQSAGEDNSGGSKMFGRKKKGLAA